MQQNLDLIEYLLFQATQQNLHFPYFYHYNNIYFKNTGIVK